MNEHQNFPNLQVGEKPAGEPAYLSAQQHQDLRMAEVPSIYKTTLERLAVELAMKMEEPEEVFARYRYTPDQAMALMEQQPFLDLLARVSKEIVENGLSFRAKAKAIAEDCLPVAHMMVHDAQAPMAVRADLIKWATKVAGYEPKEVKDDAKGGGLNLSITFAGQAPQTIVAHEPLTIEGNG